MQAASAPSSSQAGDPSLDDLLECSVCYTLFERPLQLNCGHSFCSNCVDSMVEHGRMDNNDFMGVQIANLAQAVAMDDRDELQIAFRAPLPNEANRAAGGLGGAQDANGNQDDRGFADVIPQRAPRFFMMGAHRARNFNAGIRDRRGGTEIKCPECRRPTRVPPEGLPVNYRLQDMIARLNINKTNRENELLKCEHCQDLLPHGSYFKCKSDNCDTPAKSKMCPVCAIRHHNGHDISEVKILTERDISAAKESISAQTARAGQALEQIVAKFGDLAAKARGDISKISSSGLGVFQSIASNLDGKIFTSMDGVQEAIDRATLFANRYEGFLNQMAEVARHAAHSYDETASEFRRFHREAGYSITEVKTEPTLEPQEEVLIVDPVRPEQPQPHIQNPRPPQRGREQIEQNHREFAEMMQRAVRDERDRDRNRYRIGEEGFVDLQRRMRERNADQMRAGELRRRARMDRVRDNAMRDEWDQRMDDLMEPELDEFREARGRLGLRRRRRSPVQPPRALAAIPVVEPLDPNFEDPVPAAPVAAVAEAVPRVQPAPARAPPPVVKREEPSPPASPRREDNDADMNNRLRPRRARRPDPNTPGSSRGNRNNRADSPPAARLPPRRRRGTPYREN